ncbi:MAG: M24 family metallopeptidase [Candidatus Obscuribacterales bacterium]|nr:M24 family metallopeptidase [Candidatus Obscuribacterales bacterium]
MDVGAIQRALEDEGLDAWLFYFFHGNDDLALRVLGLNDSHFFSRRWFYLVPQKGEPRKLVHRIEESALDTLPGERLVYLGWKQMHEQLAVLLQNVKNVAMQYSPMNAVPYVSRVDAGIVELVRSLGLHVSSSANLISHFEATMNDAQRATHLQAVESLREIVFQAFAQIRLAIEAGRSVTEYEIQQFIVHQFRERGMESNSDPIVAVNANSGSPHYQPTAEHHSVIRADDFVLIDLWAKLSQPANAIYGDITWTGFVGKSVPEKYTKIFNVVSGGRDAALNMVKNAVKEGRQLHGYEVDDAARNFITEKGYGEFFIHRTGHSIGREVHANGTNIDNLETKDDRRIIADTCFSIEPGVYLPDFGIRSEIDVFVGKSEVIVAGSPIQTEVIPILSAG